MVTPLERMSIFLWGLGVCILFCVYFFSKTAIPLESGACFDINRYSKVSIVSRTLSREGARCVYPRVGVCILFCFHFLIHFEAILKPF